MSHGDSALVGDDILRQTAVANQGPRQCNLEERLGRRLLKKCGRDRRNLLPRQAIEQIASDTIIGER